MYDLPSYFVASCLFAFMLLAMFLGGMIGKPLQAKINEDGKSQANAVQGSLLGLLALLLGFTFSLSLSRFDQRSAEVVNEANAIGTAWLRSDFVSDARRDEVKALLQRYAAIRVGASTVSGADVEARSALIEAANGVFAQLWTLAADEAREAKNPVAMGFASSLNDMTDALASRDAAINRHVPELVLILLFGTFILLGGVVGYSSGIAMIRPGVPVYAMMMLIVILVFLIIDLDRPRRGLIEVDQTPMISLNTTIAAWSR
jgi:hypothetical protein